MDDKAKEQSVILRPDQPMQPIKPEGANTALQMIQTLISGGATKENAEAMKSMVQLYEHMQEMDAKQAFARAFNALQSEMPRITANQAVPNNDGTVRYKFAPFESIMGQVRPLLLKHGFTVSFSTRYDQNRLVKICTLTHTQGHSKTNEFAVQVGSGPPKASPTQADGAAATYAKRFALCDALNIVIERDNDAAALGDTITGEQAFEFERRVNETNTNRDTFLKMAGATSFKDIPSGSYDVLDRMLQAKERGRGR